MGTASELFLASRVFDNASRVREKSAKTPAKDLKVARDRMKEVLANADT
jgi:hypothetical protein